MREAQFNLRRRSQFCPGNCPGVCWRYLIGYGEQIWANSIWDGPSSGCRSRNLHRYVGRSATGSTPVVVLAPYESPFWSVSKVRLSLLLTANERNQKKGVSNSSRSSRSSSRGSLIATSITRRDKSPMDIKFH